MAWAGNCKGCGKVIFYPEDAKPGYGHKCDTCRTVTRVVRRGGVSLTHVRGSGRPSRRRGGNSGGSSLADTFFGWLLIAGAAAGAYWWFFMR